MNKAKAEAEAEEEKKDSIVELFNCQIVVLLKEAKAKAEAEEEGKILLNGLIVKCLPRRSETEAGVEWLFYLYWTITGNGFGDSLSL